MGDPFHTFLYFDVRLHCWQVSSTPLTDHNACKNNNYANACELTLSDYASTIAIPDCRHNSKHIWVCSCHVQQGSICSRSRWFNWMSLFIGHPHACSGRPISIFSVIFPNRWCPEVGKISWILWLESGETWRQSHNSLGKWHLKHASHWWHFEPSCECLHHFRLYGCHMSHMT